MKVLLDTHVFVWLVTSHPAVSINMRRVIDQAEAVLVSSMSAYELAYKYASGKWPEVEPLVADWFGVLATTNAEAIDYTTADALLAAELDRLNRDPFDRALAAQAIRRDLSLLSADAAMRAFPARVLW